MKTKHTFRFLLLACLFPVIISCERDNPEDSFLIDAETRLASLVDHASQRYLSVLPEGGDDFQPFSLVNDGLIDEYTANEAGLLVVDKQQRNTFLQCLRSVEPGEDQVAQMRSSLKAYEMRNRQIIHRHREAFKGMHERMELARRDLFKQFREGAIDQEQYRTRLRDLRQRYVDALQRIRTSNAEAFSSSYAILLKHLSNILTEEQWEAFEACLTSS